MNSKTKTIIIIVLLALLFLLGLFPYLKQSKENKVLKATEAFVQEWATYGSFTENYQKKLAPLITDSYKKEFEEEDSMDNEVAGFKEDDYKLISEIQTIELQEIKDDNAKVLVELHQTESSKNLPRRENTLQVTIYLKEFDKKWLVDKTEQGKFQDLE